MDWHGKQVLVTGADGFIGSHLTERLVRAGARVRAFVHYNSFNSWGWLDESEQAVKDSLDIFAGDIRDPHGVRRAVDGCECVLHLASLIAIPYSYHSPDTYVDTNIKGTLNVLQAALAEGGTRVAHTSTSEVYGTARYVPIDEAHPLQGQSPYSATKIGADQMALAFHRSFDLPVTVVRPFNTYGPRQSARAVIPTIITQLLAGAASVRLGALTPTRDFSFVEDTVEGFLAVAASPACLGEVVNVGSGFEISIGDTARAIFRLLGREPAIEASAERLRPEKSEVERLFADIAKVRSLTGWEPRHGGLAGFEAGLAKTIAWFRKPGNLGRYKPHRYNV
ncbi:NAD-dependent 4,6-dehydratase LegB [Solidesulfovibrio sp.]|uniref:NAD-dependent 4,6-dehydratase LegB n=1 Tax=Solidesulfovibrio sp. TaxID=2910990 RepID=UPI002B1F16B8|nr:NAD-dependent 4,6-dehydratase LegB [Solidesulfovibrio sp.]MEA5088415.1 NAD-dependent 4,6-dehydratase LegB [Solidesulfovibrio sp.]